jgi:cell division protein FtsI/penicillin-binding protein 2
LASAIDAEKISPDTTYVDSGQVTEAGYTMKNSDLKAYGKQTMTNVLEKSLNTGVIFAEKLLGNKNFADYVQRFGFGEPTGVDMFGEATGNINNLKNKKSDIQFFTASFGQGITVTPIQLVSAYNALASGGVLYKPQIIDKIVHPDGNIEEVATQEVRRAVSTQTAYAMGNMLESVVVNGHGKRAGVPGYIVGGKTGTAQVASSSAKGYEEGKSIGSFAGFAPVDNPKYTVLIRMDDPKSVEWAESSAAPAFGELMKFLLDYGGVEPNQPYTQKDVDIWNVTHTLKADFIKKEDNKDNSENNQTENKKN